MTLWIWEDEEKQGDFCNTQSRHEYQHGNLTDAVSAEAEALEQGQEVTWVDAPINQSEPYEVQPGKGFTWWESEQDSQGVDYQRRSNQ